MQENSTRPQNSATAADAAFNAISILLCAVTLDDEDDDWCYCILMLHLKGKDPTSLPIRVASGPPGTKHCCIWRVCVLSNGGRGLRNSVCFHHQNLLSSCWYPTSHPSKKFHQNLSTTFWVILLTDSQTNDNYCIKHRSAAVDAEMEITHLTLALVEVIINNDNYNNNKDNNNNWRDPWKNQISSTTMKLRKSLVKPVTWQNISSCLVLPPEIIMHDAFNVILWTSADICVVVHDDLGWKNQTTRYILPRH